MIYFDNSATTRPFREVLDTYTKVSHDFFGNPSSLHTLGKEAERLLDQAREQVAALLHVKKQEIIFTSGGTESNNLAIKGTVLQHKNRGNHIITSKIEHASNYEVYQQLENEGFTVTYLDVDDKGEISLEQLKDSITNETILVSLIHVNNEIGSIQPIEEIGQLLANFPKLYFHVDHVQGITKVPLDFKKCKIDLCSISGHKFHGPKGTGALYVRQGVKLRSLLHGGVQESKIRAGTENIPGAVAMAKALRISLEQSKSSIDEIQKLRNKLVSALQNMNGVEINSVINGGAPHIVNFSLLGMKPEVFIQALGKHRIYVSTKSACSSKLAEPSRVLMAAGLGNERAGSAIRVSFSFENTMLELDTFIFVMKDIMSELKQVMR